MQKYRYFPTKLFGSMLQTVPYQARGAPQTQAPRSSTYHCTIFKNKLMEQPSKIWAHHAKLGTVYSIKCNPILRLTNLKRHSCSTKKKKQLSLVSIKSLSQAPRLSSTFRPNIKSYTLSNCLPETAERLKPQCHVPGVPVDPLKTLQTAAVNG